MLTAVQTDSALIDHTDRSAAGRISPKLRVQLEIRHVTNRTGELTLLGSAFLLLLLLYRGIVSAGGEVAGDHFISSDITGDTRLGETV